MALTTTNAQISYQDGAGAVTNVSNGGVIQVTPAAPVTFALQSTSGIITWELTFISLNNPALQVQHSWKAGQANAITVNVPAIMASLMAIGAGVQIISVVGDGVQSIAQSVMSLQTIGGAGATVAHYVDVATAAALAAYTSVNGVLTASANGVMAAIDGVTVVPGSRVLLTLGAAGADNGIYQVTSVGTASAPYVLTAAPDWAYGAVLLQGAVVEVNQGTVFGKSTWKATLAGAITVGTSSPAFYPRVNKFQVTLSGGAGSNASSWVLAATGANGSKCLCTDTTAAAAVKATATAGAGTGTVSLTGTSTDVIDVCVVNW